MDFTSTDFTKSLNILTISVGHNKTSKEPNNYDIYKKKCNENNIKPVNNDFFRKLNYDFSK